MDLFKEFSPLHVHRIYRLGLGRLNEYSHGQCRSLQLIFTTALPASSRWGDTQRDLARYRDYANRFLTFATTNIAVSISQQVEKTMSKTSKPLTLSRIEDLTLGAFAYVPVPSTLEHLNAYLNTWQGTEKSFAVLQYALQLLVPFLQWRARIQHQNGARATPVSTTAPRLSKLAGLLGDARALFSLFGVLPILQWLSSIERKAPATRNILTIERIQAWSMLLFYPLDHTRYLLSHSIISEKTSSVLARITGTTKRSADGTTSLDAGKISRLSCQLWLLYTIMQLGHLREDRKILIAEARTLSKSKAIAAQSARAKVQERLNYLWPGLLTSACDLLCALHWSLEHGLFKNAVYPDLLMFISSVVGWRNGFKAIRAAAPAVTEKPDVLLDLDLQAPVGLDAGLDEI